MADAPSTTSGTSMFQKLRAPLLGYALERSEDGARYRLVTGEDPPAVVLTGSLAECEEEMLGRLKKRYGTGLVNATLRTSGGKQFWADRHMFAGWRIQENVYTRHCRLLDAGDVRQAWGTYEACRVALEEARQKRGLKPRSDRLVVLLHGLFRSKDSFRRLAESIEERGYEVASINYPSTRKSIGEHSRQVEEILDAMEGVKEVSFVTHSLGGIVARDLLGRDGKWKRSMRVGRLVMLAPPNQGSHIAEALREWFPFRVAAGQAGQELTPAAVLGLPTPDCEIGIIAGGTSNQRGLNPLLPGDDDMVVTVDSTRLPGAADFLVVRSSHTLIMRNREAEEAVLTFLDKGRFSATRAPAPIPRPQSDAGAAGKRSI